MKKHIHKIVINGNKKYTHKYTYKFGNTNDISIELSKDSLCITDELTKIYDKNEMIMRQDLEASESGREKEVIAFFGHYLASGGYLR